MSVEAKSTEPRVNWRIEIRDHKGNLLTSKTGRTTNGEIAWTWDLLDQHGKPHDSPEDDPFFQPSITTWPLEETAKEGQLLTPVPAERDSRSWWVRRLGSQFVRNRPTAAEHRKFLAANPLMDQVPPRPLRMP